jgi:hypothetical protein
MNGLRIYIKPLSAGCPEDQEVFYSRRADGPYYRWRFERKMGEWHSSRMPASDLTLKELAQARWKAVPSALQARLDEHYLE